MTNPTVSSVIALFSCAVFSGASASAQDAILTHGFGVATTGTVVYAVGQTLDALPGQINHGGTDAFVEAYDTSGNLIWTRQFGSKAGDRAAGAAADDSGIYIVGLTYGSFTGHGNAGENDSFIVKFDPSGNLLWSNQFGTDTADPATAVAIDPANGNVYMVGLTGKKIGAERFGSNDAYLRKYGPNGKLFWTAQFGTAGDDRAYGVAVDGTGVYVTGRTSGVFPGQVALGGLDAFLTKFDGDGNQIWLRQFGSPADDRGWGIGLDSTGVYVVGRADGPFPGQVFQGKSDAYITKFDSSGNLLWVNEFGTEHTDRANGVVSVNGSVYVGGFTTGAFPGATNVGGQDCFFAQFDPSGNQLQVSEFGSTGDDTIRGVAADSTGVYAVGEAEGKLDSQPVDSGAFLIKYDFSGTVLWLREFTAN